jgi:maltose alpha-D-glucosyltransferase/alpha-amylase
MAISEPRSATFYAVDISKFQDSNGDGIGDLPGLIQRLDYIADLGFSWIWVLPFFPSPRRDNGYDITDYRGVSRVFGTLADFRRLIDEAHRRGLHVIIDLVAHHTSDQHPWFRAARADASSPYRDYYVWSPTEPTENQPEPIFPGPEKSVWTWDSVAGEYFFHRFYHYQPDLNFANPRVQDEFIEIARYWMEQGIDGFRIDAANHLFEEKGLPGTAVADPCSFMDRLRDVVFGRKPDAVLAAEADVEADAIGQLACDGGGTMLFFNFLLNNQLYLGLTRESAQPVADALEKLPALPGGGGWLNFLRNLDEVDLERLSNDERAEVFARFAPDEDMRIYGRGIRRRLGPMLDGNQRPLRMLFSLLFSLPGPPLVVYGEEIGMGDDLSLPERMSVHLPMQWSGGPFGGFTSADTQDFEVRPLAGGEYGYMNVNVAQQRYDPTSLLVFLRGLLQCRDEFAELWESAATYESCAGGRVLRSSYRRADQSLVAVHNFSSQTIENVDTGPNARLRIVLRDEETVISGDGSLRLGPYGYCWLSDR